MHNLKDAAPELGCCSFFLCTHLVMPFQTWVHFSPHQHIVLPWCLFFCESPGHELDIIAKVVSPFLYSARKPGQGINQRWNQPACTANKQENLSVWADKSMDSWKWTHKKCFKRTDGIVSNGGTASWQYVATVTCYEHSGGCQTLCCGCLCLWVRHRNITHCNGYGHSYGYEYCNGYRMTDWLTDWLLYTIPKRVTLVRKNQPKLLLHLSAPAKSLHVLNVTCIWLNCWTVTKLFTGTCKLPWI